MVRAKGIISVFILTTIATAVAAATENERFFDAPWIGYDTAVYPEGLDPFQAAVADFNADGAPDLATVSWGGTPWLSILFGDGKGAFLPPVTYQHFIEALDLVAEDFDNDGDVDIVTADTGRFWEGISVSLFRNDGAGNFNFAGWWPTGDDGPSGITAADFDRDGFMDVAVAHDEYINRDNTVSIILNSRTGGFQSPQVVALSVSGTNEIASGDIDDDGDIDIVAALETNRWVIVLSDSEGIFQQGNVITGIESGSIPEDPTIHLGDIDLDGDLDVFFSNLDTGGFGDGAVGLWRNFGNGTFASPERIPLTTAEDPNTGGGIEVNTADVTGDDRPDLLVVNGSQWFVIESDEVGGLLPARLFRAGNHSADVHAPDLDGDGDLDVIVLASQSLEACVYLNPGDGGFVHPPVIDMVDPGIAPAFTSNLESGDIEGDGDLDVVIGYRSDFSDAFGLTVRRNNGDGTFGARENYSELTYAVSIALRDMDGDSDLDLLYVTSDNRFRIRKNDGNGDYSTRINRHVFGGQIEQVDGVDVDNDNDLDVVVNSAFGIGISKNLGNDNYAAPTYHDMDGFVTQFAFGDFNEDGNLDLLTNSAAQGYPEISFGNGDGTFGPAFTVPTGRDVHAFAVDHIDHDGNLDFAAYFNLDETGLSIRRGRGDGNFFPNRSFHGSYWAGDHTSTLDLADVDGDGNLDAMTGNFGAQDFSFWKGAGDGTFARLVRYGIGHQAVDIEFGDFDGDGDGDLAAVVQKDAGRWWYAGIVIIRGTVGTGGGTELIGLEMVTGTLLDGGLPELSTSDDSYVRTRSGFGEAIADLHKMEMIVNAITTVDSPSTIDLSVEARIDQSSGVARLLLRNWNSGAFDQVAQYPIGMSDDAFTVEDIDATNYVSGSGEIDLMIKHNVFRPFLAFTFESNIDHVTVNVR